MRWGPLHKVYDLSFPVTPTWGMGLWLPTLQRCGEDRHLEGCPGCVRRAGLRGFLTNSSMLYHCCAREEKRGHPLTL